MSKNKKTPIWHDTTESMQDEKEWNFLNFEKLQETEPRYTGSSNIHKKSEWVTKLKTTWPKGEKKKTL